jgi:hypothetical protein
MPERSADWMGQARRDLAMAGQARDTGFFEWACFILQGVKGAEQEDPGLQTGDESGAALPVINFNTIRFSVYPSNNILSVLR